MQTDSDQELFDVEMCQLLKVKRKEFHFARCKILVNQAVCIYFFSGVFETVDHHLVLES